MSGSSVLPSIGSDSGCVRIDEAYDSLVEKFEGLLKKSDKFQFASDVLVEKFLRVHFFAL